MKKIIQILLLSESVWSFGAGLFVPIFAIFSQQVGGDIFDAGIAAALFLLATATMQWPLGMILDKIREKIFISSSYFLGALVFAGYVLVENKWELFVLQLILGVAYAVGDTAWESLFDRSTDNHNSGRSWSMYHMFTGYATVLGIVIGSVVIHYCGFDAVFIAGSIFAFLAGTISMIFLKNPAGQKPGDE